MYYFDEMTLEQIAAVEGATHQAIGNSINKGIEEIKKIWKIKFLGCKKSFEVILLIFFHTFK